MFGKLNEAAKQPRKSTMLPMKERLLAEAVGVEVEAAMLRALRRRDAERALADYPPRTIINGQDGI